MHRGPRPLAPEDLAAAARGARALVCTLADRIDAALLEALVPPLRVVANFAVGTENIDLEAARRLGVQVANTPDVLTDATAEIAVALLLAGARRIAEGDRFTRAGRFEGWGPLAHLGQPLYGRRLGIVGAGRIGWRVAATLRRGFDCEVWVHSRRVQPVWERELAARFVALEELLERADFVSLHCPLLPETRHLIDAAALARMPRHAGLVNTARGAIVDEAALVRALREGALGLGGSRRLRGRASLRARPRGARERRAAAAHRQRDDGRPRGDGPALCRRGGGGVPGAPGRTALV